MADHIVPLPPPRAFKAATWAVGLTWASAVFAAALGVQAGHWGQALMALVATLNAAGWFMATRRWLHMSVVALALVHTLDHNGIREWPDGSPIMDWPPDH